MRPRRSLLASLLALALVAPVGCSPATPASPVADGGGESPAADRGPASTPSTPSQPGHELYGFLPYWEMHDGIADHLRHTPLTTLALFSVTHTGTGALNTRQRGYRLITGDLGSTLVREAHDRGTRVDIVYTSFGTRRNSALLGDAGRQDHLIASLVDLVGSTGTDGVNVDVEGLDPTLVPAYAAFVGRLRDALVAADGGDRVTVATGAGPLGAAMATAAVTAGADRAFLMGYDYRTAGTSPGATAPLERSDGGERGLRSSLDLYAALGVPPARTLLGLPLYGVTWPVAAPVVGAPETGRGDSWIPRQHLDLLLDGRVPSERDATEQVEVYFRASDGTWGAPAADAVLTPEQLARTWTAIYVDSPATLAPKLTLANDRGLAGAGFWAIGYERGLPGYAELMDAFVAGAPLP